MKIRISEKYIWFAVARNSSEKKLHFYSDDEKFRELDIRLDGKNPEFFFPMDVSRYEGKNIEILCDDEELLEEAVSCKNVKTTNEYRYRPKIHFTAEYGWINDPNGLIYADGVYHLYYQWNPYGTDWGNMHWGHAISRDLITWEHRPTAMEPDEYGTIYSGCAFSDSDNASGFGKDALLYFYTASGGRNEWSSEKNNLHTQRVAVSTDGGDTLLKKQTIIPNIIGENRDPKVFWHEESGAYIMVLYLEENEFAIFRSENLLHWTESQRFSADKMWECPNLFKLPVERKLRESDSDGGKKNDGYQTDGKYLNSNDREQKWIFWSADGYYMIGDFDGFEFKPETEVLSAYDTELPYAAQTFYGTPDRTVHIAWYRTKNDKGGFRGMMSIPTELSLVDTEDGLRIKFKPVKELVERSEKLCDVSPGEKIYPKGCPVAVYIGCEAGKTTKIRIGKTEMNIKGSNEPAMLLIDHGIIECFSEDGTCYNAVECEEDNLNKCLSVFGDINGTVFII